jgi:hypothetical protein
MLRSVSARLYMLRLLGELESDRSWQAGSSMLDP